jgi:filamentous hemagglutinin
MQIEKTASGSRDVVSAGSVSHVNPTGSLQNCTNCVFVVDNQISTGAKASALPRSAPLPFNELEALYDTKMSGWTSRSAIESTLLNSGNGTRAVIYGMDDAGVTAHVWNAVVQKGKINYIDGQIGRGGAGNFDYFPNLQFGIIK